MCETNRDDWLTRAYQLKTKGLGNRWNLMKFVFVFLIFTSLIGIKLNFDKMPFSFVELSLGMGGVTQKNAIPV